MAFHILHQFQKAQRQDNIPLNSPRNQEAISWHSPQEN